MAQISIEANQMQTIKAIMEAEAYPGPSLIIGYTPCINHGIRGGMGKSIENAKAAVESGYWQLYRYDPRLRDKGKDPMRIDFKKQDFSKMTAFMENQVRFSALRNIKPSEGEVDSMLDQTVKDMEERQQVYKQLADLKK